MSLWLSDRDVRHLQNALAILATPAEYECIDAWRTKVLEAVVPLFGGDGGSFVLPDDNGQPSVTLLNRPNQYLDDFIEYQHLDPALHVWLQQGKPSEYTTRSLTGGQRSVYTNNDIYDLVYSRHGVEECATAVLDLAASPPLAREDARFAPGGVAVKGMLCIYTDRVGMQRFGDEGVQLMGLLHPVLRAAAQTWRDIGRRARDLERMIDDLGKALCICDGAGAPVYQNVAARALMHENPDAPLLESACSDLARTLAGARSGRKTCSSVFDSPLERVVGTSLNRYTLRATCGTGLLVPGASVIVAIEPMRTALPDVNSARHLGLTRREGEVAQLIAVGLSNRAIAGRLFIAETTARRHTEKVLQKLGAESRAQVAAILLGHARGS